MRERGNDKRNNKRYAVEGISGNVLYTSDLEVLNISNNGAAIETSKRLELNREYTFKIKHRGSFLNLKGLIVWATLVSKMNKATGTVIPVYRVGIRFTHTLNEKANTLVQFIEENKVKWLEKRLGGVRFKIETGKKVKVDLPQEYMVKKISLSGMLVETEYPLELDSRNSIELFINGYTLQISIRVTNCHDIITDGIAKYDIGIEFIDISEQDENILQNFINTLEEV
jgi:hypothetical protein